MVQPHARRVHRGHRANPSHWHREDKDVTRGSRFALASVELVPGASYIGLAQRERYVPVKFSVRGGSAIIEAQQKVADKASPVPTTGPFSRRGPARAIALAGAMEAH